MHAILAAAILAAAGPGDAAKLTLVSEGGMPKLGYYMDSRLKLSPEKPKSIRKLPPGLESPMYAVLDVAARKGTAYHVVLADAGKRFLIDTNGDGDLTNDPEPKWESKEVSRDGASYTQHSGFGMLDLGTRAKPYRVRLGFRVDRNNPDTLLYYRDYAVTGELTLDGKTYSIALNDNAVTGDFRGKPLPENAGPRDSSGVFLMIDLNADGRFDRQTESFDVRKPFAVAGKAYEVQDMAQNGLRFRVVRSNKTVAATPTPTPTPKSNSPQGAPDHSVGKKITAFEAKTTDGRTVNFPADYKGKIVMIDFWATWCGPCMKEVPGLVKTYNKLHRRGFEILGVAMENERSLPRMKPVTKEQGMTWSQICDGQGWNTAIAKQYGIRSIPACFLVDGDTGEILATGQSLRGASLEPTIERALSRKKGG